jgi:prefoldin subunit 5
MKLIAIVSRIEKSIECVNNNLDKLNEQVAKVEQKLANVSANNREDTEWKVSVLT